MTPKKEHSDFFQESPRHHRNHGSWPGSNESPIAQCLSIRTSHLKAVVGSIPAKELSDSFRVSLSYHLKYPLFISFTRINICHPLHLSSEKSMHAVHNFSPCSTEGHLSLEPTIMDKFFWDTHSSAHLWDFTEALPYPPLPTQSMLGINWSTLSPAHCFHFISLK